VRKTAYLVFGLIVMAAVIGGAEDVASAPDKLWDSSAGLSFLSTSGNSETETFGLDFKAIRKPTPWGLEFTGSFNRAESNSTLTAERYFGGLRGTRELSEKWTLFAGLSGEKDEFAGFDLRSIVEAGATYKAVDSAKYFLSFDGALSYTDEDRLEPVPDESFMSGLAAMHFIWKFSPTASLSQDLSYFPNFDTSSDWRAESVTALQAAMTDSLAVRLSYEMRYRNEPIGDADDLDTTTKASLVLNF